MNERLAEKSSLIFQPELLTLPAALSVAAAREMVGRPFLRDHQYATILSDKAAQNIQPRFS